MAPKILLTGVTGYIGGDAFYALHETHPEFDYTLLVRNEDRVKPVRDKYPDTDKVRIVYGGPDASYLEVLEEEASKTDVILHAAESADDVSQATAISNGVLKSEGRSEDNPIFWVHICGTGILQWYDQTNHRFGQPPLPSETYDDIASLPRLLTLPDTADHRDVDKIVLGVNHLPPFTTKTAIVAPPTIYGVGRGPVNTISQQIPALARFTLQHGYAPVVGPPGLVEWDNVHVHDLSALLTTLVSLAALEPDRARTTPEVFGGQAYFFAENGTPHVWARVAADVAAEATRQGYLKEAVVKTVGIDDVPVKSWGANSRSVASRARKYLGWSPKGRSVQEEMEGMVRTEAERLGVKKLGGE